MKRALILSSLAFFLTIMSVIYLGSERTTLAYEPPQIAQTPTPFPKAPTERQLAPQPKASAAPVFNVSIALVEDETQSPTFQVLYSDLPASSPVTITMQTLRLPGAPLSREKVFAPSVPIPPPPPGQLVDNWDLLVNDNFETTFPITTSCVVQDKSNDGYERFWGKDSLHYSPFITGTNAIWPARGGINGVNPASNNYPANVESWLLCGPYDFTYARDMMTQFMVWMDITDPDDSFAWAMSTNGQDFTTLGWHGPVSTGNAWIKYNFWSWGFQNTQQMWIALIFKSDGDTVTSPGVWIDDLNISRHNNAAITCGTTDPGTKGVHLPPYEAFENGTIFYPTIRNGDTQALQGLMASNAKWARLLFNAEVTRTLYAFIEQDYDRMVDSLCNAGINVLGLVNHQTLKRPLADANSTDEATAASYRSDFVSAATWYAQYFKGRITYWEVWNEPNVFPVNLTDSHYAALLKETATSVKAVNPNAKVLFAGLGSAWKDSRDYLQTVYARLNDQQGGARPFDIFAVHPYFDRVITHTLNPAIYMHAVDQMDPGDRTIVDKFVTTMQNNGDLNKKIWVTEVGWNSGKGDPDVGCLWDIVVDERTQATYLKKGFDVLFNEARSVEKVIWYQYQDGRAGSCTGKRPEGADWRVPKVLDFVSAPSIPGAQPPPGFYGLYGADKHTIKPSQCAFRVYPNQCTEFGLGNIYLPLIIK